MATIEIDEEGMNEFLDWYKNKPQSIKDAIAILPPTMLYQFKTTKKQCYIIGYEEPNEEEPEVTVIVQKTGEGGALAAMGLNFLDTNRVFGVKITDLEPVKTKGNENSNDTLRQSG